MKKVILSLGGSVIHPKKFDYAFLKELKKILIESPNQYAIYCGGGALARRWQKTGTNFLLGKYLLDWIGIIATRINAMEFKRILGKYAGSRIITNPDKRFEFKDKIIVAAGYKPGRSTDYGAAALAKKYRIPTLINMSNIDFVYDKDPKEHKDAKPVSRISWKAFRALVGNTWTPGLNMPFDPIASQMAEKSGLKVIIIGKDLKNFENLIKGKKFKGTTIG